MNGMGILSGLTAYLLIGGIILGLAHNSKSKECGRPMRISADSVGAVATWPAAIGFAIAVNSNAHKPHDWCADK